MDEFVLLFLGIWVVQIGFIWFLPERKLRRVMGWVFPITTIIMMLSSGHLFCAWQRLLFGSLGLLYLIKGSILFYYPKNEIRRFSLEGILVYMSLWPGMNPDPFRMKQKWQKDDGGLFIRGYLFFLVGMSILMTAVVLQLDIAFKGWLVLASIFFMVHLGYSEILTVILRKMGWSVAPLFDQPFKSISVQDFWSARWNLAFVDMNKIILWKSLKSRFGSIMAIIATFLISGILHELAISFVALQGWGLPLVYFIIQILGFMIERKILKDDTSILYRRVWTWAWITIPLPLLFHAPFHEMILQPFINSLEFQIQAVSVKEIFDRALWLAAIGCFCTLIAGAQVPGRLNWKEDLAKLTPFNRKIFYNYYCNIGSLIVMFGVFTLVFHQQLMRGESVALFIAGFIGLFWLARLLVDFLYFDHNDWPKGDVFVIGHVLLTSLFICLAGTYLGVVIWHIL